MRLVNHPCRTSDTTAAFLPLSSRSGLPGLRLFIPRRRSRPGDLNSFGGARFLHEVYAVEGFDDICGCCEVPGVLIAIILVVFICKDVFWQSLCKIGNIKTQKYQYEYAESEVLVH